MSLPFRPRINSSVLIIIWILRDTDHCMSFVGSGRWQCLQSRRRSWVASPSRQHLSTHSSPRHCTRSWDSQFSSRGSCTERESCASLTSHETPSLFSFIITSSGSRGKACRLRKCTSCRTVRMESVGQNVGSWQRSYEPRSIMYSVCSTTILPSVNSPAARTIRQVHSQARSRLKPHRGRKVRRRDHHRARGTVGDTRDSALQTQHCEILSLR